MKYVLLVSHGMFAPGLHSALNMLAGGGREDILSASLEDGMGSDAVSYTHLTLPTKRLV